MRLAAFILRPLRRALLERASLRSPDFIIGTPADPYLKRWWIIPRNRIFNVYLHQFLHSDDDRALHDHPWWNISILLEGSYIEHTIAAGGVKHKVMRRAGEWKFRAARTAHRLEIRDHSKTWSLFITGPVIRTWGFHCPEGWRSWKIFVDKRDTGQVGRGCE